MTVSIAIRTALCYRCGQNVPLDLTEIHECYECDIVARHMQKHKESKEHWTVINSGVEIHKQGHVTRSID